MRCRQTQAVRDAQGQSQERIEEAQHCQHRRQLSGHVRLGSSGRRSGLLGRQLLPTTDTEAR